MKILYLHQYFNTPNMSGGTRSYEMARRFVLAGHEVHMITSYRESTADSDWFYSSVEGIHVHWLPVRYTNKMSFSDRVKAFFKFAFHSAIKSSNIKADIVFATSTPLTIAIPAIYTSRRQKIPLVFEVRDLWPELPIAMGALKNPFSRFIAKKLEHCAYKNSSAVVALSPGMKSGVLRAGFPSDNVAVIPNSCDIDLFKVKDDLGQKFRNDRSIGIDTPLLLYTGTFGLINGVSYLVELAVELKKINSDIQILAIGGGIEFESVTKLSKEKKVYGYNFMTEDYLKKKDIPAALSAATMTSALFIDKPEMRANSANKFFDSLAAGKPIMINYGGWMHDLIESRGCGINMWNKDISDVAIELNEKIRDSAWLSSSSNSAKLLSVNAFSRDILANQLIDVLESTHNGMPEFSSKIAPGEY